MLTSRYIEDIFIAMVDTIESNHLGMQYQDRSAAYSFYQNILDGRSFTEKQGAYVLKLLNKYRNVCKPHIDYEALIELPVWKQPFRVLDQSKQVWIEKILDGIIAIGFRFPYSFKDTYDEAFSGQYGKFTYWDREKKVRYMALHEQNVMNIYEFCKTHNFEIDKSFIEIKDEIELIWHQAHRYIPYSFIEDNKVKLKNASDSALEYFSNNAVDDNDANLILAKNMGYIYSGDPTNSIQKICRETTNRFWVKEMHEMVSLVEKSPKKVVIILDRASDVFEWVQELNQTLEIMKKDKSLWRVCFRASNKDDPEFNEWVSENGFGGKIDSAKFLIFQHKPHKWLLKKENDVTMLVTNYVTPVATSMTRNMINHHPCVLYVGNVRPTELTRTVNKGEKIVEL